MVVCSFCDCVVVCPLFISSLMICFSGVLINSVVSFVSRHEFGGLRVGYYAMYCCAFRLCWFIVACLIVYCCGVLV